MKRTLLPFIALLCAITASAQTADNLYVRSLNSGFDYKAGSFVIDSSRPAYSLNKRGLLLWAANTDPFDAGLQALSLDQIDSLGNPLTEHVNIQSGVPYTNLIPKKIIRSEYTKSYYLLAHVINSPQFVGHFQVHSTSYVLKLDDNLHLLWASKIHFNPVTADNAGTEIEYNDIMETSDKQVTLVGRYRLKDGQQQALLLTKLDESTGANIWWFWYFMDKYDMNGLSIEEASNTELVVTGYVTPFQSHSTARELLYAKFKNNGGPLLFRKYQHQPDLDVSGDQISRFLDTLNKDHFFITGYVDVDNGGDRQALILDISQDGTINSAAHFGGPKTEDLNDHIFTQYLNPSQIFVINCTGNTTSFGGSRAYYGSLEYNHLTRVFSMRNFDVIRNTYGGNTYGRRTGIEIKYAGPGLFSLLLNSSLTTPTPTYTHAATNVFIRDFNTFPPDTTCYSPRTPPIKEIKFEVKEPGYTVEDPPFTIYDEKWDSTPRISKRLECGSNWHIYPRLAVRGIPRRNRYNGPGDVVPPHRLFAKQAVQNDVPAGSLLFPNPAEKEIRFTWDKVFDSKKMLTIKIYSSDMHLLSSRSVASLPVQTVSIAGLRPGLYIMQAQQDGVQRTYRFIKN